MNFICDFFFEFDQRKRNSNLEHNFSNTIDQLKEELCMYGNLQ